MVNQNLTEEQRIERKAKLFKLVSKVLVGVSVVAIGIFVFFAMGTKKNIDTMITMETQALRSKMKQIINLQRQYFEEHGEYVLIRPGQLARELPRYDPDVDGNYVYEFDPETGVLTGRERVDVLGNGVVNDWLELTVNWEENNPRQSNFFWPESDREDFAQRRAALANQ